MEVIKIGEINLEKILQYLKKGKIIVCPTDTVYGLLADATNKKAVERIFKIKKRDKEKPLPIFVKDIKQARTLALIDKRQEQILKKHWPGKFTFILRIKRSVEVRPPRVSRLVRGRGGTIGLRIPDYRLLNLILEKFKKPLAQTSANISGKQASIKIKEVISQFENEKFKPALLIDGGNLKKSKPSKVIDIINKKLVTLRY